MSWTPVTPAAMPDSDATVLGYSPQWESEPVWICWYDSETGEWRDACSAAAILPPTHWMDFPEPPTP